MPEVAPGTIVVFADVACPWATLALHRLQRTRADIGLEEDVAFDLRAFPLELINEQATPKSILDAEIPVVGALGPELGWRMWPRHVYDYPVTMLLALEAVQAAKEQGLAASEELDAALRAALFAEGRNISLHHEVVEVARSCKQVDGDLLEEALVAGRARRGVFAQRRQSGEWKVEGSPHLYLPDGGDLHNPGIVKHWEGEPGEGFPVVDRDDPTVYTELLRRAAARS